MRKIKFAAICIILIILSHLIIQSNGSTREERKTDGKSSSNQQWGFVAMVETKEPDGTWNECTATIISSRHVLTAAHCIILFRKLQDSDGIFMTIRKEEIFIRINAKNENNKNALKIVQTKNVYIHHNYNNYNGANDITILEAEEPFMPAIEPIKLASYNEYKAGQIVLQMGFGEHYGKDNFTIDNHLMASGKLRKIQSSIYSIEKCQRNGSIHLPSSNACVGAPKDGVAPDDSGGALLVKGTDGKWYQIGVASFDEGMHAAIENRTTVFVKISKYCPWIKKITSGETECYDMEPVDDLDMDEIVMDEFVVLPSTTEASNGTILSISDMWIGLIFSTISFCLLW